MEPTGLEHKDCGGHFFFLDEPMDGTTCDIVCSKCELHTGLDSEFLGFCGCGIPDQTAKWVMKILEAFKSRHDENCIRARDQIFDRESWGAATKLLENLIGEGEEARHFIFYQLDHLGLLEHGGNITGSWLSDKGEQVLDALRRKPWWDNE